MKKIIFSTLLLLIVSIAFSQQNIFKETKNIYLLDVTLSMFGYNNSPDIFDDVRAELVSSINAIQDPKTEIVVVIFQDEILETWSAYADQKGKKKIIKNLESISKDKLGVTRTNIYDAWKKGRELVNSKKLNVIYLLTDGIQNSEKTSREDLYREVENWRDFSAGKDYYAFLVELVENAKDEQLRRIIKETSNAQVISGIDFFVFSVKDSNPIVSLFDDLDFVGDRINSIPEDFEFSLSIQSDTFVLKDSIFHLREKPFIVELSHQNISLDSLKSRQETMWLMYFLISFDKAKYPNIKLLNNTFTLKIKNEKEMVIYIKALEE